MDLGDECVLSVYLFITVVNAGEETELLVGVRNDGNLTVTGIFYNEIVMLFYYLLIVLLLLLDQNTSFECARARVSCYVLLCTGISLFSCLHEM
jgi:hypothetical protein